MKIYKSNFPYWDIFILPTSLILAFVILGRHRDMVTLIVCLALIYFYYCFVWVRYEIHEKYIAKRYYLRPILSIKKIPFENIYSVEIRKKINVRFQYVIFHFSKEDEKAIYLTNRYFYYNKGKTIDDFILALQRKGITIKLNIDKEYKKDFIRFNKLLNPS